MHPQDDDEKAKKPARDYIELKHVETRQQEVNLSNGEIGMLRKFEHGMNPKSALTNDEITLINVLEKQKLFMDRIAIKLNQTRQALGMSLFMKNDIETLIASLMKKGIVATRVAPNGANVFYLTDAGLEFLDII